MNCPHVVKMDIQFDGDSAFLDDVCRTLSMRFGKVELEHVVVESSAGVYARAVTYVEGQRTTMDEPIRKSKEAFEMYFELFPEDSANYVLEDGEYTKHKEEATV